MVMGWVVVASEGEGKGKTAPTHPHTLVISEEKRSVVCGSAVQLQASLFERVWRVWVNEVRLAPRVSLDWRSRIIVRLG